MSPPPSSRGESLLAAARADAPTDSARAKMWASVTRALGGAPSGNPAPPDRISTTGSVAAGGGAGALKMIVASLLLGGAVTAGVAATGIGTTSPAPRPAGIAREAVVPSRPPEPRLLEGVSAAPENPKGERPAEPGRSIPPDDTSGARAPESLRSSAVGSAPAKRRHSAPAADAIDPLSREASLIAEARASLVRGDPLLALREARAARSLPARQLVPEELAVEAEALRALGRESEAAALDEALRSRYPESALAR